MELKNTFSLLTLVVSPKAKLNIEKSPVPKVVIYPAIVEVVDKTIRRDFMTKYYQPLLKDARLLTFDDVIRQTCSWATNKLNIRWKSPV